MPTVPAKPYLWPQDGSFSRSSTALVIIDMQNDFCHEQGYLVYQGGSVQHTRTVIPKIAQLLEVFRERQFPIYHTREGHRPDLSTLSSREHFRSRNNSSGLGIGDQGPLGRMLVRGEHGHDIVDELYPLEGEPVIDKPGRSAFAHTDLDLLLRIRGVRNLVICGVTTDVCVHSTMREANDRGYDCLLVEDASGAGTDGLHRAAVEMVQHEGGIFGAVATTADIMKAVKDSANGG
ncbi:hypothetical protein POSPLADRAFT_1186074 [Postia placenta MAD-698-R-SB12]|uniref:Isochorismatase-like domain-containing protein n=1 Tax=Postia placenta MAD-698-R-SB12 TaxID=670580 RepID=A0A1X6MM57_9APHY|nr:hypothetical protein POSPLADRAFT_1186074 [Postia placenta MAD-698-R-SB12]OSX57163.1 hypothetical protein POSPLADRAFT_1186074 [Postia placenta MAD-698-R-SB12]